MASCIPVGPWARTSRGAGTGGIQQQHRACLLSTPMSSKLLRGRDPAKSEDAELASGPGSKGQARGPPRPPCCPSDPKGLPGSPSRHRQSQAGARRGSQGQALRPSVAPASAARLCWWFPRRFRCPSPGWRSQFSLPAPRVENYQRPWPGPKGRIPGAASSGLGGLAWEEQLPRSHGGDAAKVEAQRAACCCCLPSG